MEPGFQRGDILFLNMGTAPARTGEIVVFNLDGRDIPIVHRVIKVHQRAKEDHLDILTKVKLQLCLHGSLRIVTCGDLQWHVIINVMLSTGDRSWRGVQYGVKLDMSKEARGWWNSQWHCCNLAGYAWGVARFLPYKPGAVVCPVSCIKSKNFSKKRSRFWLRGHRHYARGYQLEEIPLHPHTPLYI
jgi:signal peptidase I